MITVNEDAIIWNNLFSESNRFIEAMYRLFHLILLMTIMLLLMITFVKYGLVNAWLIFGLIVVGYVFGRFLYIDFYESMRLSKNYYEYQNTTTNFTRATGLFWFSVLACISIPAISSFYISGEQGFIQTLMLGYVAIAIGLMTDKFHQSPDWDIGVITIRTSEVTQKQAGKQAYFIEDNDKIEKIGLFIERGILFLNDRISLTFALKGGYFFHTTLEPDQTQDVKQIMEEIKNWIERKLNLLVEEHSSYDEWLLNWGQNKEVKNFYF